MKLEQAIKIYLHGCSHECEKCPLNEGDENGVTACGHFNVAEGLVAEKGNAVDPG